MNFTFFQGTKKPLPDNYEFNPKIDITVYELAIIVKSLFRVLGILRSISVPTIGAERHFDLIKEEEKE